MLPNLGKLSLGPAADSTAAVVPCRYLQSERDDPKKELDLAFERFKAIHELRQTIEGVDAPADTPAKRVSNRGILSKLHTSVENDDDYDPIEMGDSLALGYQRQPGDSWSKTFEDHVECPEPWTTPGPASIIRMHNYNWCDPESAEELDKERSQSYMLKAVLFVDLAHQRRRKRGSTDFPEAYINRVTMVPFYGNDTQAILEEFLAECETYTFKLPKMVPVMVMVQTTVMRQEQRMVPSMPLEEYVTPLYVPLEERNEDNAFPSERVTVRSTPGEDDASMEESSDEDEEEEEDEDEGMAWVANPTYEAPRLIEDYYKLRFGRPMPLHIPTFELYSEDVRTLEESATRFWNVPFEKRPGLIGAGRMTDYILHPYDAERRQRKEAYTFWTSKEYDAINRYIHATSPTWVADFARRETAPFPLGTSRVLLEIRDTDFDQETGYTEGEASFKGPEPDASARGRQWPPGQSAADLGLPEGATANDCLDIAVHVPIKDRVALSQRMEDPGENNPTNSCVIDNTTLASPGAGRHAIVVVRPSYHAHTPGSSLDSSNAPLPTDVYTWDSDGRQGETRPNIFLQWLQENERRKWGVARSAQGEPDQDRGWYDHPRDSYKFTKFEPNFIPFMGMITGSSGRRVPSEAVAKVPGANMRDVMVTDCDFYNSEVREMLPSALSNLSTVHKVPQGLVFFVDVSDTANNDVQADPCKYIDHIMNQCLHRGSGGDLGCIAWLLDEMGKTPGYERMANAKLLSVDKKWATQSTHTNKSLTPYEQTTGLNLTNPSDATSSNGNAVTNFPDLNPQAAHDVADALGNGETHRFTAGCRLAFGLELSEHNALHSTAIAARRKEMVRGTRADLASRWAGVVDV